MALPMSEEMAEKVRKLPLWAREYVRELQIRAEPNAEEITRLRRENERLKAIVRGQQDRIDAMLAMFQCAAKGGNEVAQAVQKIVEDYLTCDSE
jgi:FtsZ-binding cell division protein ZapB